MEETESKKDRFKPLTYEDMYGVEEPEPDGRPLELDIDMLLPFPNQPFHSYTEEEMDKMVESIKENGVISPIVVRPKDDGTYEIISGHNRVEACRQAGIMKIPSFIREVDDDTAVILMVDSNLRQREELSDMEKARAYEMKINALNRKLGRPLKKEGQVVLAGLQTILMYGYPCNTPDGFTEDEARQATANAIRFWLSENGESGSYSFTNRKTHPDAIRAKKGYEHVLTWADELLQMARDKKKVIIAIVLVAIIIGGFIFLQVRKS